MIYSPARLIDRSTALASPGHCSDKITFETVFVALLLFWALGGCASYDTVSNEAMGLEEVGQPYSALNALASERADDVTLVLAFSGGGTRAAALAYGVLEELHETTLSIDGQSRRLFDEIDVVSSVSGGSFTAAYLGVFGDSIFEDFEPEFLRRDITSELLREVLDPASLFSRQERTKSVIDFYDRSVFNGATFGDLQRGEGPLIVINASDLGGGVRFSFLQEYFDLLCSELSTFPIARAVTASSAVPLLFNPVVLENHSDCDPRTGQWLQEAQQRLAGSPQLTEAVEGLKSYLNKDVRRYIHLVDGGITDNLGLRALFDLTEVAGGAREVVARMGGRPAPQFVVISVDASTRSGTIIDASPSPPSLEQTINAVADVQLHRYNAATLELLQHSLERWSAELSTPKMIVKPYLVQIDFQTIEGPARRRFFNQIPTNFSLTEEQADKLIAAGHELLRINPEYQRFLEDFRDSRFAPAPASP